MRADGQRGPAVPDVHVGHDREAEGDRAHDGRLPRRRRDHPLADLRPQARDGRLLVRRRHRLDHGAQLHRLRAALQRRHLGDVRGHARLPESRALVGDRRALRRHDPLHGSDGDPGAHEVGAGARGRPRPLDAAPARLGRRADQPRGVDVVPRARRRRALPDRRHVVADRDRDDPDLAAARRDDDEAGLGDEAVPGRRGGGAQRAGRARRAGRRLPRARAAVARDDARHLRRRRALPRDLLVALPRALLRGRRRADRRRRRLLAARPRRRRDERLGPPALDDRGRVGARRPPARGRGGRVRALGRRRRARRSSPT